MKRAAIVQQVAGWIIAAIALLHLGVAFAENDRLSLTALWFVGSGFALLFVGGLNVILARLDGATFRRLRTLRLLSLVGNLWGAASGLVFIALTSLKAPQGPALVVLFVIAGCSQVVRTQESGQP